MLNEVLRWSIKHHSLLQAQTKLFATNDIIWPPQLHVFKVVDLEMSCSESRSKNPELEHVSSMALFIFGRQYKYLLSGGAWDFDQIHSSYLSVKSFQGLPGKVFWPNWRHNIDFQFTWVSGILIKSFRTIDFQFFKVCTLGANHAYFLCVTSNLSIWIWSGFKICMLQYIFVLDHLDLCWSVVCDVERRHPGPGPARAASTQHHEPPTNTNLKTVKYKNVL